MKGRALILATVMVLSIAVAGVGGASAATAADSVQESTQQASGQAQQATAQTNDSNGTDERTAGAQQAAGPQAGGEPVPIDIPPNQLENGSLDMSTLPATVESNGEYAVRPSAGSVSRSDGDAARQPTPEYRTSGPQLLWPSLDATAQSGPENASQYYFKDYTLEVVSPEVEVWVANDLSYPEGDNRSAPTVTDSQTLYLGDEFTNNIEPKESELYREPKPQYGDESQLYGPPGPNGTLPDDYYQSADNESRTVLLVDNVRDQNYYDSDFPTYIAGFFSPTIGQFTDRNVMVIDSNAWDQRLGNQDEPWKGDDPENESAFGIESTTAHEYQHLLHSYEDPDETTWINEGLSEITPYRVGYGTPSSIPFYEQYPSNSLIEWGDQESIAPISILADYGGAGLFQLYGSQQTSTEFTKAVFDDDANGIQSVENSLDDVGEERDFYSFYQDFSTALVTDGRDVPDRYQIENVDFDVNTSDDVISTRENMTAAYGNAFNTLAPEDGSVDELNVSGTAFRGTPWESVVDPLGETGHDVLYSEDGNNLDNNAIFSVDPTDSSTLTFDTYYDIERGFDYGFVQVSTDGGETWTSLENENTTSVRGSPNFIDPKVQQYLPGFTGDTSGSWVTEEFDLSEYADDGEVLISFRYITDPASVQPGWYVRDIGVSGTDVGGEAYSGTTTEPFESLREARENPFRYQFSVLGIGENGATEVEQYGPKTFADADSISLESLPNGEFDRTILTATWAPEKRATGTVPYGYEVNPETESENTLTIRGTGPEALYTFSVTDDLEKSTANGANINANDEIRRGYVGDGEVGIVADSYTFEGGLETIKVFGDAEVYLNGERLSDGKIESIPNDVIEVEGTGPAAQYAVAATGSDSLQKVTANNANINANDEVFRTTANGEVGISRDAYGFDGIVDSLNVDGDANVYVNGLAKSADGYEDHVITIVGTGEAASYDLTVASDLSKSVANFANINANDETTSDSASGEVGSLADSYVYDGDVSAFSVDGDVVVYVDGERIDQGSVADDA